MTVQCALCADMSTAPRSPELDDPDLVAGFLACPAECKEQYTAIRPLGRGPLGRGAASVASLRLVRPE
jgi:hypothetical protein